MLLRRECPSCGVKTARYRATDPIKEFGQNVAAFLFNRLVESGAASLTCVPEVIVGFGPAGFGRIKGRTYGQPPRHALFPPVVGREDLSKSHQGSHGMLVVFPNDFTVSCDVDLRHLYTRILAEQFWGARGIAGFVLFPWGLTG